MAEKSRIAVLRAVVGVVLLRVVLTVLVAGLVSGLVSVLIWMLGGCVAVPAANDTAPEYGTPPTCDGGVLYAGATLIDADARVPGGSICVVGGRMAWVSADPGAVAYVGTGKVVDIAGKFVVPGLVDAHVHLTTPGTTEAVGDSLDTNLRANLAFGVTQVIDLGGPASIFDLRDRLAESVGTLPAPRIAATGPFLTAAGSHPCETYPDPNLCTFVASPTEGAAAAADLRGAGADAIKVALADAAFTPWGETPRLELDVLDSVVAEGLPVFAHIDTETDALDAAWAGVAVLAHPPFAAALSPSGTAELAGVAVISTVSAFGQVGDLVAGRFDPDDASLLVLDGTRENWRAVAADPTLLLPGWLEANAEWTEFARANLGSLRGEGATLLPGSDAGYLFVPHGWGLHRELLELEALGMTPHEVLVAATVGARGTLTLHGGLIATGQPADFLVLSADPDLSVANLAAIETVVLAGVAWSPHSILAFELPDLALELGAACLAGNECGSAACDPFTHTCVADCAQSWDLSSECGTGAWCMPESGVATDADGLCHAEATCDLYVQDCVPEYYSQACVPFDEDTNACWFGGPQREGDRCDETFACAPGLYCSPVDAHCYALCDPAAVEACDGTTRCTTVEKEAGGPWFGLCL